nr:sulfur carrier protein ThiS [Desulfobulbaceae bacterium]
MNITVNGEPKVAPKNSTVYDYVCSLNFDPETVVVEIDGKIIQREEYQTRQLKDGCILELIRFIGGG